MATTIAPFAETFTVSADYPDGCFITSVDLFFASASATDTNSVQVNLVETANGYPTEIILPFASAVVKSSAIVASASKLIPVNFKFPSLIQLKPATEYAIVVISNSNTYNLWTAMMGQKRIDNPAILITQQPALGAMFKSQNGSTWVPEPTQALTFNLNRAVFNTNITSVVTLVDSPLNGFITLPPNPFKITSGQTSVKVHHPNHGLAASMLVQYYGSTDLQFNNIFTVLNIVNSDYYVITAALQSNTGYSGGGQALTERTTRFDTIAIPNFPFGRAVGLQVAFKASTAGGVDSDYTNLTSGSITKLDVSKYVQASVNKIFQLQGANSFTIQGTLSSTSDAMSPLVNLNAIAVNLIGNRINYPSLNDINYAIDGTTILVGTSNISFSAATNSITVPNTTDYTQFVYGAWIKIVDTGGTNDGLTGYISNIDTVNNLITIVGSSLVSEASRSASIIQYLSYISETENGGTADSKYITTPVALSTANTGFRVMVSLNVPQGTDINMYYRSGIQSSATPLSDATWVLYPITYKNSVGELDFIDYEYDITGLPNYDEFQFKFVYLSQNTAYSPKIANLRLISHA